MSVWRIKSTKYNTYYSGGKSVKNPDFINKDVPKTKWSEDKIGWQKYYDKRRKVNESYNAAKDLNPIEPDNVDAHIELMKKLNVDHDYLRFSKEGKAFATRRSAECKLSNLTKTTKKVRTTAASQVLFGNELSVRYKVVESELVDKE